MSFSKNNTNPTIPVQQTDQTLEESDCAAGEHNVMPRAPGTPQGVPPGVEHPPFLLQQELQAKGYVGVTHYDHVSIPLTNVDETPVLNLPDSEKESLEVAPAGNVGQTVYHIVQCPHRTFQETSIWEHSKVETEVDQENL